MNKPSPIVASTKQVLREYSTYYHGDEQISISIARTKGDPELRLNSFFVPVNEAKEIMDRPYAINMDKALQWLYQNRIRKLVDRVDLNNPLPHQDEHFLSRQRTQISRLVSLRCPQLNHFD